MNYLKITKYIYLGVGFIMVYDFVTRWNEDPKPWLSAIIAGLAFFTYFFRTKFAKKFEDRNRNNNSN
jgi:hypothetical protein